MKVYDLNTHSKSSSKDLHSFFDKILGKKPFTLIVHADWCGHCQTMKGEWVLAKKAMKRKRDLFIVEIEHSVYNHFVNHHKDHTFSKILTSAVGGFPCIARVGSVNGGTVDIDDFDGNRVKKELVSFMLG